MKFLKLFLLLYFMLINQLVLTQEFNVMSYNLRYDNANDNENWWGHRKEAVVDLIKDNNLLVFGVQEAVLSQMEYIDTNLSDYSFVGVGRDDGKEAGEFSAIFYNSTFLEVITEGTFWLSPTPDLVSKAWDAALPRICSYAKLRMKDNNKEFWFFNTHFDHVGVQARDESSKLIIQKIRDLANSSEVVILTGDFNTTSDKAPYGNITQYLEDAAKLSDTRPGGPIGTFNGFKLDAELKERIDYIFTKNLTVLEYKHLENKRPNGLWISDHLPVVAKVRFN